MKFKNEIHHEKIENQPFVGSLFLPTNQTKLPCIIVVPGSDGGVPETLAEYIASCGYTVLALGYFGAKGLPNYLEGIHLEYFKYAIGWLKDQSRIQTKSFVILGYSRGGELALLIGSLFPELVNGIIAYVPNSSVCGGFPYVNRPAWLLSNQPALTYYLKGVMSQEETLTEREDLFLACEEGRIPYHANTSKDPYHIVDLFLVRQAQEHASASIIPVENITCPLLVISGKDDKIWPSSAYSKQICDRLNQKNSLIRRKFVDYPNVGHGIIFPYEGSIYHRIGKFWCTLGGIPEANKQASKDAWKETFEFLESV